MNDVRIDGIRERLQLVEQCRHPYEEWRPTVEIWSGDVSVLLSAHDALKLQLKRAARFHSEETTYLKGCIASLQAKGNVP